MSLSLRESCQDLLDMIGLDSKIKDLAAKINSCTI